MKTSTVSEPDRTASHTGTTGLRLFATVAGFLATALMTSWLIAGLLGFAPSMVDVFGIEGMRIPAGIAIGGLLTAAVGLNRF